MRRLLLVCTALLACSSSLLHAAPNPPDSFTLRGHVLDQSRGCVVGARVEATPQGTGAASSTTSDQAGEFTLILQPGTYTVTVTAPGFTAISQPVRATSGATDTREFVLAVAGFQDTLTVSAPSGYEVDAVRSATKTLTPLRDVPQSITVVTKELMQDQMMTQHRRRHPLRARHRRPPGREQPRPGDHPRQQLVGRLLRQRRPRRCAVLPRPLQPRARRSAEGAERA